MTLIATGCVCGTVRIRINGELIVGFYGHCRTAEQRMARRMSAWPHIPQPPWN